MDLCEFKAWSMIASSRTGSKTKAKPCLKEKNNKNKKKNTVEEVEAGGLRIQRAQGCSQVHRKFQTSLG